MHDNRRPRLVALLLAVTALCALTVAGLFRVFVSSRTGQRVEMVAMGGNWLGQDRIGPDRVGPAVERVLDVVSVSSLAAALLAAMAVGVLRGRWRSALAAAVLVGGSTVTTEVLKTRILERPDFDMGPSNSLPSGHTTVAACVAAAAVLVSPRRARPFVAILGAAYAVATGLATVVAGWHRPSDAMAAYAVVLGWCLLTAALVVALSPLPRTEIGPGGGHRSASLFLAASAVPLAALAVALILWTAQRVDQPFGELRQVLAYSGGMSAVAAAGLFAMAVWLLVAPLVDSAGRDDSPAAAGGPGALLDEEGYRDPGFPLGQPGQNPLASR